MINPYPTFLFTIVWYVAGHLLDAPNVHPTTLLDMQYRRTSTWNKTYFIVAHLKPRLTLQLSQHAIHHHHQANPVPCMLT